MSDGMKGKVYTVYAEEDVGYSFSGNLFAERHTSLRLQKLDEGVNTQLLVLRDQAMGVFQSSACTAASRLRLAYSAPKGNQMVGGLWLAIGSCQPPTCLTCRWLILGF